MNALGPARTMRCDGSGIEMPLREQSENLDGWYFAPAFVMGKYSDMMSTTRPCKVVIYHRIQGLLVLIVPSFCCSPAQ